MALLLIVAAILIADFVIRLVRVQDLSRSWSETPGTPLSLL